MAATNDKERLARITIPVTGMTCASCVRRLERAISRKEGVAAASINFAAENATIIYDPAATNPDELVGTIRDAGYGAEVQESSFGVAGMTCASCVGRVERALKKVPCVLDASAGIQDDPELIALFVVLAT